MGDISIKGRSPLLKGGRVGLKKGGKPWGTGPQPGTLEFFQQETQTPKRKRKVVGGAIKIGKILGKKGVDYIRKNRKAIRKEVYSPEGTKKAQDMIDKLKRKYPDSQMFGPTKKAAGGRIGRASGGSGGSGGSAMKHGVRKLFERFGGGEKGKPHSSKEGRIAAGKRNIERMMARRKEWKTPDWKRKPDRKLQPYSRQPAKKGGKADKNWIQKAVNPKHKGFCTPMTKKTCTPRRKALARTFKKMGRERKAKG